MNRLPATICAICAALTGAILALTHFFPAYDELALLIANIIMCLLSLSAWAMLRRNVGDRAYAFARGVQGVTMLRLAVCLIGVLSYALIRRPDIHKPTLFLMFGIYAVYTIVETAAFSRQARKV